jgi:hypothetical protein
MPFRPLVPFPQEIFVRFIYSDREVGYDAAVVRVSYRRISAKTPRYVDSSPLRPPNSAICCDALPAEGPAGVGLPGASGVRTGPAVCPVRAGNPRRLDGNL